MTVPGGHGGLRSPPAEKTVLPVAHRDPTRLDGCPRRPGRAPACLSHLATDAVGGRASARRIAHKDRGSEYISPWLYARMGMLGLVIIRHRSNYGTNKDARPHHQETLYAAPL
jgi:hypothetical protein